MTNSTGIDQEALYGRHDEQQDWRNKLSRTLAHRSLNIPQEDDVHVDNSKSGMGWKELAVIGATAVGGLALYNSSQETPTPPVPAQVQPVDSEYEIRFFDQDGNPVNVPHISRKK